MPVSKVSFVAHVPGHKNSKGEAAPWVIKDHKTGKILSSHKTQGEAKTHLQQMHAHSGSAKQAAVNFEPFVRGYIECALWSSNDDSGTPLDRNYSEDDLAPSTLKAMVADCEKFQSKYENLMPEVVGQQSEILAGHDFWLTRNHHGSGFWDGDYEHKEELTKAAHSFGEADLYVGDDGYIYQAGTETSETIPPREEYAPTPEDLADLKAMGIQGSKKTAVYLEDQWEDILQRKGWLLDETANVGWRDDLYINPKYPAVTVQIHIGKEQSYFQVLFEGRPATRSTNPDVLYEMLENAPNMGNWKKEEPVKHDKEFNEADRDELKAMGIIASGAGFKLVDSKTGQDIPLGSDRKTFRGEDVKVLDFTPPKHEGSTGRVYVEFAGKGWKQEFFPSVVNAKIVRDNSMSQQDKDELKRMGIIGAKDGWTGAKTGLRRQPDYMEPGSYCREMNDANEKSAAAKPKCPHCGSDDYGLMPTDFETAKCNSCGKNWNHGIVKGINDPKTAGFLVESEVRELGKKAMAAEIDQMVDYCKSMGWPRPNRAGSAITDFLVRPNEEYRIGLDGTWQHIRRGNDGEEMLGSGWGVESLRAHARDDGFVKGASSPLVNGVVRPETGDITDNKQASLSGYRFDYEANGNDVVLIAHTPSDDAYSVNLTGDDAKNFWMALDSIEESFDDSASFDAVAYRTKVDDLVASYFESQLKTASHVIAVEQPNLKRAGVSSTYVSGVKYNSDGNSIESFTFTADYKKAKAFEYSTAASIAEQIQSKFKMQSSLELLK